MPRNVCLLLVALTVFMGCKKTAPVPETGKLTINVPVNPATALITIAKMNNRFAQQGLEVEIKTYATGKTALDRMGAGDGDLAVAAETPLAAHILSGDPLLIIANLGSLDRSTAVLARRDHGITKPRNLAGKNFGVTRGTSGEYLSYLFLTANGMEMADVNIKNFSPESLVGELQSGRLDAASLWHPYLDSATIALGDKGIVFESDVVYMWTLSLIGRDDFIKKNPMTLRAIIRALLAAQHDYESDPVQTLNTIAGAHNLDSRWVQSNADNMRLSVTLNQAMISVLDDNLKWGARTRKIDSGKIPNPLDYIYWDALRDEQPDAVTVIYPQ